MIRLVGRLSSKAADMNAGLVFGKEAVSVLKIFVEAHCWLSVLGGRLGANISKNKIKVSAITCR
jgi:hypothetical protein